jgi:hypothetical protein
MNNAASAVGGVAAGGLLFFVLTATAVIAAWCVPLVIAGMYDLPHKGAIAVLSLALGWTGVAWLAALVITIAGAIREPPPLPPRRRRREEYPSEGTRSYGEPAGPYRSR